jgi:predicted Zn-dependent peptidase
VQGNRPDVVEVEALVKLPALGPHERAAVALLTDCLLEDTDDFGKQELLERTSDAGETIEAELLPDAVRVHFAVPASEASSAISILSSVLHGARLPEEALKDDQAEAAFRHKGPWESGLFPERPNVGLVRPEEVHVAYRRFFTPEQFTIQLSVPAELLKSDLADQWRQRVQNWEPEKLPLRLVDHGHVPVITDRPGSLTTIVLRSASYSPNDLDKGLLCAFALGAGKGATVFQAIREGLGWSYRQEAPIRGNSDGFEQDVAVIAKTSDADFDRAQALRPAILKAIEAWTEADRLRALGAAKALLLRGVGMNPMNFLGTRPTMVSGFLQAYWRMKTGGDYDPDLLLDQLEKIALPDLKSFAKGLMDGAGLEVIRGKD